MICVLPSPENSKRVINIGAEPCISLPYKTDLQHNFPATNI